MQERKKNRTTIWLAAVMCVLLGVFASGCRSQNESVTEITLMHGWGSTEADHVAMRQIYQDFEKDNPDIHINLVSLPTADELIQKVEDSIMVGEIPDIIFLAGQGRDSVFQYMVNHGYALDLMPFIEEDAEFRSNLAPANLNYWTTEDNRIFTISDVLIMGGGYWYNRDIFESAGIEHLPATWEEFEQVCSQIMDWAKRNDNGIKALQLSTEGYLSFASHILYQKSGGFKDGVISVEQNQMMDTLSTLEQIHRYSISSDGDYNYRDETSLFNEGKLAIYVNGVWGSSMIREDLNVAYAVLPSGDTGISCEASGVGYVLGNTGNTAREEASVRFIKYMMTPAVQKRIILETQQVVANPKIRFADFQEQMPRFCQAIEAVQRAKYKIGTPNQLWSSQQISTFRENIIPVLQGDMNKQTLIDLLKR